MSVELKLLNLKKINTQSDEEKTNLEVREMCRKLKSCHGENNKEHK